MESLYGQDIVPFGTVNSILLENIVSWFCVGGLLVVGLEDGPYGQNLCNFKEGHSCSLKIGEVNPQTNHYRYAEYPNMKLTKIQRDEANKLSVYRFEKE